MRILNCTETSRMISLRSTDVVIKPLSLSLDFNCSEKVFQKIIQTPNYQNVMRFVMDPSERQILDICPVIQGTVITMEEAKNLEIKFKDGYRLPEMDINGNPVPSETKESDEEPDPEPKVEYETPMPSVRFEHHSDEAKLSKAKDYSMMNLIQEHCDGYTIEIISNDPKVAAIEDGKVVLKGKGRTNIIASVRNEDGQDITSDSYVLNVK